MLGTGTQADPFIIQTLQDLQNVNNNLTAYYELRNNIDATDTINWNSGAGFQPIGNSTTKFTGFFDGKGYKISNLYINSSQSYCGMFAYTSSTSIVSNLTLENCNITGTERAGTIACNCDGIIRNCRASGNVKATSLTSTYGRAGGIVAQVWTGGLIENCYSEVTVNGYQICGGLIGVVNDGTIKNCFATGTLTANSIQGGLIGLLQGSVWKVTNCYSKGLITNTSANNTGGFAGQFYTKATYSNNFWDINTSGLSTSLVATGKTTAEMKAQSTYTSWNFDTIWGIDASINNGYPYLRSLQQTETAPGNQTYTHSTNTNILTNSHIKRGIESTKAIVLSTIKNTIRQINKGITDSVLLTSNIIGDLITGVKTFYKTITQNIDTVCRLSMGMYKHTNTTLNLSNNFKRIIDSNITKTVYVNLLINKHSLKMSTSMLNIENGLHKNIKKTTTRIFTTATIIKRQITKSLSKAILITHGLTKGIRKSISKSINLVSSLIFEVLIGIKTFYKDIASNMNITNTISRRIDKTLNTTMNIVKAISKNVTKTISDTISITSLVSKNITKSIINTITVSSSIIWYYISILGKSIYTFYKERYKTNFAANKKNKSFTTIKRVLKFIFRR